MTGPRFIDIGELIGALNSDIARLAKHLFPAGAVEGDEFRVGDLAGDKGRSLGVRLTGDKRGVWSDFATGEAGDALDLIAGAKCGGDKKLAVRYAREFLGDVEPALGDRVNRHRELANRIWLDAPPGLIGTPVEVYLRGRGIELCELARQPSALRYGKAVYNSETKRKLPAMLAAVHGRDGRIAAVHRTYLQIVDADHVAKAAVKEPKMTLGRFRGGAIRISRGASDKPLGAAPAGDRVILTEGIEDALTVALAKPEWRVLSAVSLANMASVELPPAIETVLIVADNEDNPKAERAAAKAIANAVRKFKGEGRRVLIARAPAGRKDLNEILQKGVG